MMIGSPAWIRRFPTPPPALALDEHDACRRQVGRPRRAADQRCAPVADFMRRAW